MECLAGSQLAELLSGSASADLASRVDAHIDRCADCRQLLVHLARVISGSPVSRPSFAAHTDGLLPDLRAEGQPLASAELINRRYRILNLLGEGGMGRVYRVYDRLLSRELALKQVLFPLLSDDSLAPTSVTARLAAAVREPSQHIGQPAAESTLRSRTGAPPLAHLKVLTEEFRMLASLHHPNVVRVFDYGCDRQGHPFFTMELLPTAQPLLQFARGRSIAEQTDLLVQLLDALAYLHRRGIVHRDLTPNNVLVTPSPAGPVVKLVDFGLAVDVERGTTLSVAGTFLYMAPELFQGERPSELSDLYAVGMLAYQMFTGSYPFPLNLGNATLVQRILTTAPDLSRLPAAVQPVLGAALAKDPRSRQTDVVSLRRELAAAAGLELKTEPVATRDSYLLAARFVGRHAELSVLQTALATARQGEGSAWLICGESGVGKSRFLEELRIEALHAGLLVMRGQAIPGGDAYHVFREVLRLLALQLPLDAVEAGVLCSLLPDLPALLESPLSTPHPLDSSGARLRLFHVVDAILSRLPQTTLVLLEDLQWADAESLALLGHLASSASKRTLLIITTCRDEERPPPLPPLQKLRLSRMNRQEVAELCSSMLGRSPLPQPLLDLVARETEGNPYFIVEVMRVLAAESGSLAEVGMGVLPARLFAGGVEQALGRRLSRAPVSAHPLLRLAALAGRELDLPILAGLVADSATQIQVLADLGILELSMQRWRFAHDKLREQVCDSLASQEKTRLHKQLAAAFEQQSPFDESRLVRAAIHFREAQETTKAAQFYVLAGDSALRRGAPSEAAALLQQAQRLHAQTPMPKLSEVRLWRGLTEARFGLGRLRESELALRQLCKAAGSPLPTDSLGLWSMLGQLSAGLLLARLGLTRGTVLEEAEPRAIAAELLAGLGVEEVFVWTDQPELALLCTLLGMHLEDQLGLAPRRNYHRSALFFILSHTPLRGLCLRHIEQIERRDAAVLSGTQAEIDFLRVRALVEINDGQLDLAAQHAAQAVALARLYKDDLALLHSLLQLQLAAAGQCDFTTMLAVSREMEPLAIRAENARYLTLAYVGQGAAQINLGNYADAVLLLEKARSYLPQELGPIPESVTLALLASAHRNVAQLDRAVTFAGQALQTVKRVRWNLLQLRHTYVCILDVYLNMPQPQRYAVPIDTALAKLRDLARRFPQAEPDYQLFMGLYYWRFGKPSRAARALRLSIEAAATLKLRSEQAIAQYWFGCFARSRAGAPFVPEGAEPSLRAALAAFEHMKAAGMVARTRAALQSAGEHS